MKNPIGIGLAIVATAAFASAHWDGPDGDGPDKDPKDPPLLSNALKDGLEITYKPGGGITFDGGDEFKLNMHGRLQVRWAYTDTENDGDYNTFALRRARLTFQGHVFNEDVTYKLQTDFAEDDGGGFVKDAWIGWRFLNDDSSSINLRVGLQKMRSGLQADLSSSKMEFPERSIATRTFSDVRAAGALLEGGLARNDNGDVLMWHAGIFNNDTAGGSLAADPVGANEGNRLNYTLGLVWDLDGGGTNEHYSEGDLGQSGEMDGRIGAYVAFIDDGPLDYGGPFTAAKDCGYSLNLHAAVKSGGGLAGQGEVWFRRDKLEQGGNDQDADAVGWYAQGSWTTPPGEGTQYGIALRGSQVRFDDPTFLMPKPGQPYFSMPVDGFSQGVVTEVTAAINAYYHKHKLKSQLAYTYMDVNPDSGGGVESNNHGLDLMFTLLF